MYENYYIEFLQPRYPDNPNSDYLEPIGCFSFQAGGRSSEDDANGKWYAFQAECRSDKPEHFLAVAKLLKFVMQNRDDWRMQPEDVLKIIGAVEHVYKHGHFLPVSYHGYKVFKVMKGDEATTNCHCYSQIFAPTELLALKQLKRKKWDHMTLEFDSILDLNSKQETTYKFA